MTVPLPLFLKSEVEMEAVYTCPLCGEKVPRELVVFMQHADRHIVQELSKHHPDWVASDGSCERCVEYYRRQLRGDKEGK